MPNLENVLNSQKRFNGVRANFVVDATGNFVGKSGSSRDISNESDLAVLKKLRSLTDVIVTDAATARRERYQPSKWAPIVIWSKSGNFSEISESPDLWRETTPNPAVALAELLTRFQSILLETGPTLTRLIAEAKLIDELKLTVVDSDSEFSATATAFAFANNLSLEYLEIKDLQEVASTFFFTLGR